MPYRPATLDPVGDRVRQSETRARHVRIDSRRGSAASRGYDRRWRKARDAYLAERPYCAECAKPGRAVRAVLVDHIVPHHGDPALFWDQANWQPLCKHHHDVKTAYEAAFDGGYALEPDWLRPATLPLTIVCGAPASGKSSFITGLARPGDTVIDLDQIKARLSGLPLYHAGEDWTGPALRVRNALLGTLSRPAPPGQAAWFQVGAASPAQRQRWVDALQPRRIVVLEVPPGLCLARIAADPCRAPSRRRLEAGVERWWSAYQRRPGDEVIAWARSAPALALAQPRPISP